MISKNKLIGYAINFISFLVSEIDGKELNNIESVILFGSVARGEHGKESDVDLFVKVTDKKKSYALIKKINTIKNRFFDSKIFRNYWSLRDISNDINIIVGTFDEWKDIKDSIVSDGITLYQKYKGMPEKTKNYTVFFWEHVKPESKRVLLNKRLFGYKQYEKRYLGLIEKYGGEKLGANVILIPTEHSRKVIEMFREMKITLRNMEILLG